MASHENEERDGGHGIATMRVEGSVSRINHLAVHIQRQRAE